MPSATNNANRNYTPKPRQTTDQTGRTVPAPPITNTGQFGGPNYGVQQMRSSFGEDPMAAFQALMQWYLSMGIPPYQAFQNAAGKTGAFGGVGNMLQTMMNDPALAPGYLQHIAQLTQMAGQRTGAYAQANGTNLSVPGAQWAAPPPPAVPIPIVPTSYIPPNNTGQTNWNLNPATGYDGDPTVTGYAGVPPPTSAAGSWPDSVAMGGGRQMSGMVTGNAGVPDPAMAAPQMGFGANMANSALLMWLLDSARRNNMYNLI